MASMGREHRIALSVLENSDLIIYNFQVYRGIFMVRLPSAEALFLDLLVPCGICGSRNMPVFFHFRNVYFTKLPTIHQLKIFIYRV
jgi:hypothetical protein